MTVNEFLEENDLKTSVRLATAGILLLILTQFINFYAIPLLGGLAILGSILYFPSVRESWSKGYSLAKHRKEYYARVKRLEK